MNDTETKITAFAARVEQESIQRLKDENLACAANIRNARTSVKPGHKYTKVDIGSSGRYMVEMATGNIFGIKAYGQIHRGHFYGTLETIDEYFWGGYYPIKKTNPIRMQGPATPIPSLTFAPEPPKTHKVMVNGVEQEIPMTHHVVKNLLSGQDVVQAKNTPLCCDVSSETYHSM